MSNDNPYRSIIEKQTELVCRFLPDRTITFVNYAFQRYLGKQRSKLIGQNFPDQIMGRSPVLPELYEDRRQIEATIDSLGKKKHLATCEHRVLKPTGEIRWVQWNLQVLFNTADASVEFQAIGRDTSERKRKEAELEQSEEKYRSLISNIPDAVWTTDDQMRIVFISNNILEVSGFTPEEVYDLGKWEGWYDRIHPADLESIRTAFRALVDGARHYDVEYRFQRKDGKWAWLREWAVTTYEKNGVRYVDGLVSDITERKQVQTEKLRIMQKAQLNSRLASVGKMASGIAHEVKNPLFSVIGIAELIMKKELPEELREDVEIIHDAAQRASTIIDGLLTFARQHKAERKHIDINELIAATLALRLHELETANIAVDTFLTPDLPRTMVDGNQLKQVFLNIIINAEAAIKSVKDRGNLAIETEAINDIIRISFTDDGPGIAKEDLEKIFDPFFTTKKVGDGTGLGLSICHGIITEHHGRIYAKSRSGKGATFILELPIVAKPQEP